MLELKNVNLAVEFGNWIGVNDFYLDENSKWYWYGTEYHTEDDGLTTKELFNQFWKEYNDK